MYQFICPPMPHFIMGGEDTYAVGGSHPDRSNIGVFDLLIVMSGCLHLEENGEPIDIRSGSYAILRPDRSHRTAMPCDETTYFYWIHFHTVGEWSVASERLPLPLSQKEQIYAQVEYFPFYLPSSGPITEPQAIENQLISLLRQHDAAAARSQWKRQQMFHTILDRLQQSADLTEVSPQLQIAERAAIYLRQHFNVPLSYKQLAEELHFHANYISICMKKAFGCTPLEYVTRYRIEKAKRQLIHTNDPVGKIADDNGFGSFPYFIRCFAKHTGGMKPKAFRMQFRTAKESARR
ncbi:helix-turn-helix domain-containing protein [Paenibacillus harenae]|uniref:helix-turn-helix domain-containing protein n=1 Tax=Paenibacillus harenae TaxID=306543 RepID=UPI002790CBB6|nr:helix-turn-helix domain-containing protein [Paenibacillus harenae]MDQ0058531.1 AraC-like DNA-binding protein [Paenibacillus harenae]